MAWPSGNFGPRAMHHGRKGGDFPAQGAVNPVKLLRMQERCFQGWEGGTDRMPSRKAHSQSAAGAIPTSTISAILEQIGNKVKLKVTRPRQPAAR